MELRVRRIEPAPTEKRNRLGSLSPTVPLTLPVRYVASRVPGQVTSLVGPSIGPTPVLHTAGALRDNVESVPNQVQDMTSSVLQTDRKTCERRASVCVQLA
jgi:hypothetical protein